MSTQKTATLFIKAALLMKLTAIYGAPYILMM